MGKAGERGVVAGRRVVEWPVPKALRRSPAVANRELLARKFRGSDPDTVMRNYVYMDRDGVEEEFSTLFRLLRPLRFEGRGLEVGAGVAPFSAMVVREFPRVEGIDAVEIVPGVARWLQPAVGRHVAGERADRITAVIGSFDDLRVADGSYDFCIEIGSLHHSDDVGATLKGIAAKLKPGAPLVMLDRAHPDGLPERQRELMLALEYSDDWKRRNGYPPERLTRRGNGEHEITLGEWEGALAAAGFAIERRFELRVVGWRPLLRACVRELPFPARERLGLLPTRVKPHRGETWWMLRRLAGAGRGDPVFHRAVRDHSVFVARKA